MSAPSTTDRGGSRQAMTPVGRRFERHELVVGAVVGAAVFLYDLMYLQVLHIGTRTSTSAEFWCAVVLSGLSCVPYAVRGRRPGAAALTVFAAAWGYVLLDIGLSPAPLVMSLLMLYTLGTRYGLRVVIPAVSTVAAWVVAGGQPLFRQGYLRVGEAGVLILAAVLAVALGVVSQMRARYVEGLKEVAEQLARQRAAQARIVAAEERTKIAREIHDIVSHNLSVVVLMTDGAIPLIRTNPARAEEAVTTARDTGRAAMAEMRRMVGVLRAGSEPSTGPLPGLGQVEELIEAARRTGARVVLHITGHPPELPGGIDLCGYRVVQEALTNTRKHAGLSLETITVRLDYGADVLTVQVVDDGRGTTEDASEAPGHGLVGMRERVTSHGGTLHTGPLPQRGFEVRAELPMDGGAR